MGTRWRIFAPMSLETINAICKSMPGAEWSDPWVKSGGGHNTWKVGDKMFANIGSMKKGVALKTASVEDAHRLEDMFGWPKAPYMHRSWVQVPFDLDEGELRFRVETSYVLIRAGLTAKARNALPPFTPTHQS